MSDHPKAEPVETEPGTAEPDKAEPDKAEPDKPTIRGLESPRWHPAYRGGRGSRCSHGWCG